MHAARDPGAIVSQPRAEVQDRDTEGCHPCPASALHLAGPCPTPSPLLSLRLSGRPPRHLPDLLPFPADMYNHLRFCPDWTPCV
jgi:hypothetical protein